MFYVDKFGGGGGGDNGDAILQIICMLKCKIFTNIQRYHLAT